MRITTILACLAAIGSILWASIALAEEPAEGTSKGFETSIDYRIIDGLSAFAGFSYNAISFDEYHDGKADYSGNRPTYTPEYNFNLGALYRSTAGFYASADVSGYGKSYLDVKNEYKRDPYETVNMKIGYEVDHYDVYLYAKNLFNEKYDLDGQYNGTYIIYSEPREIGVSFSCRF